MAFAYTTVASGLLAMLSRVIKPMIKYHSILGRIYLVCMLWCMASSLLIHNYGLPFFVIISFIYLIVSITIGYLCIWAHSLYFNEEINNKIQEKINEKLMEKSPEPVDLGKLKGEVMGQLDENKSFKDRFFSLKYLHGILMSFSWYQMAGRLVVTNPSDWGHCKSYPAYKCSPLTLVSGETTIVGGLSQTTFIIIITIPAVIVILAVAIIYAYCASKKYEDDKNGVQVVNNLEVNVQVNNNTEEINGKVEVIAYKNGSVNEEVEHKEPETQIQNPM